MEKAPEEVAAQEIKVRDPFLDVIKGIAILLVLVGHTIQYASGKEYCANGDFYQNVVFKFIYGFHMPLFAIVSGYLFEFSLRKNSIIKIVGNKCRTLLVPIFSFAFIVFCFSQRIAMPI